ncbi:MAG: hypothetical protein OEV64_09685 [Desulfobulbaceae bacterium]|nr:hypothetical protein [Desulfobulbaceae bacterium]
MKFKSVLHILRLPAILLLGTSLLLSGCGQDRPFSYRYTSAKQVVITYKNISYTLTMGGQNPPTPFAYEFEPDGDIDITIEGKTYEIDSPYDRDKKKSSSTKKSTSKPIAPKSTTSNKSVKKR